MKTKFRGFSKRLNEWVYGDLVEGHVIVNGIVEINNDYITIERWETVVPDSVGQYTSLDDLGYKELYEGDICRDNLRERRGVVVFSEGKFGYASENDYEDLSEVNKDIEVIGNMYKNSDYLEEEQ